MTKPALSPALWAIRAYRGSYIVVAVTGAVALAAFLPVTTLARWMDAGVFTRLDLSPIPPLDLGFSWSQLARDPTAFREVAVLLLFRTLVGIAVGAFAVAASTILSVFVARGFARAEEMRTRQAVGAARRHLRRAALAEGSLIGVVTVGVGLGLALPVAHVVTSAWPGELGRATLDPSAVAVLLTFCGIVLGAGFPLLAARPSSSLTDGAGRPHGLVLPVLQLGFSLTIVVATGMLGRATRRLETPADPARDWGRVFALSAQSPEPRDRAGAYAWLLSHFRPSKAVDGVSLTSAGALVGRGTFDLVTTDCGQCGSPRLGLAYPLHPVLTLYQAVSADTFRLLGLRLIAGRGLTDTDRWDAPRVAVVSRSLARSHFQRGDAVGRRLAVGEGLGNWYTVVGIVEDQPRVALGATLEPPYTVYFSILQHPASLAELLVRGPDVTAASAMISRTLRSTKGVVAGAAPVSESALVTMETTPLRWFGWMLGGKAWFALVVATVGTLVVMSLWVRSLLPELGLRRAMGARRRAIVGFVLWRTSVVVVAGVLVGLWFGILVWGSLAEVVPGVPAWDPRVVVGSVPWLAGAAFVGAIVPTLRAVRTMPALLIPTAEA